MDIGVDTQQGADTYNIEIWLPSETDENYSSLKRTSEKVKDALIEENEKENKSEKGNEKVALVPKKYSSSDVVVNVSTDPAAKVVAAISFSEDFAKKYHFDEEQRKKNGNVAVLAMMGGILPVGKNFFRMGFSVETIAGILGDHVIHDRQVSHVFLIRVDNKLGDRFEEEFSRKIESQNCSLDILSIDADVKKATIGVLNENVRTNNTPTTTSAEFVKKKAADEKESSSVEHVISQWLSGRIRSRSDEGLKSVVIYGYWEGYWDFVKEVLRCEDFRDDEDWLYVESNYPLLTPILYNKQSGSDLTNIVEIKEADKLNVKDPESDRIQEDFGQIPSEEKDDDGKIKINLNPSDTKGSLEETEDDTQVTGAKTKGFKDKTKKLTEDVHVQGLGRVRCFTGKLVEKENSFITFAKETVRLLRAAIRYAQDKLEKEKKQDDVIPYIRERICEFLVRSKFYASEHLGSFFFRKDGELFFPLYLYNGKLERQRIVRESCCNDVEFTKEAIADQLLQLSNSLSKITRAKIPRNLKVRNLDGAKEVFEEFCDRIAEISGGGEIDFVSYYPNTERQFYPWHKKGKNVGKTEQFVTVSIFDDVCKNIQGVIQINLKDLDLEDNDAYRVYLVCERAGNIFDALTLAEWWNRQSNDRQATIIAGNKGWERCLLPVKAVVFAKSRIGKQDGQTDEGMSENEYKDIIDNANYAHYYRDCDGHESKFKFDEILSGLCKLLGCSGDNGNSESDARFLYYIPEYIPEDNKPEGNNSYKTGGQGGIVMATCCKLSLFDLQIIENMVSRIFSKLKTCLAEHDVLLSNIKSAIGSIMSRNGSHNIGSHVLAALSHNVGTMPDDRVLYQYIQHRMDYIATATTERPQWRQPTMIVSSLMKEFLMQRHLLDHISGSEGLHAYKFQGQSIDDNDKNTIRMHIRRVRDCAKGQWEGKGFLRAGKKSESGNIVDFIDYDKSEMIHPDKDVAIAVPGGVVGNHAFYTIIENVLRNAAKHEWAEAMRVWKMACELLGEAECLDTYKECQPKNLDVYVDFLDDPEEGKVRCRIWNDCVVSVDDTAKIKAAILRTLIRNCDERKADGIMWEERLLSATKTLTHLYSILKESDPLVNDNALYKLINYVSEETAKKEAILAGKEKEKFDKDIEWRKGIVSGLRSRKEGGEYKIEDGIIRDFLRDGIAKSTDELQKKLEGKIKLSFIDESTGSLRKENWGIAEMRISAGYLQCRGTGHIGGLPGAGEPCDIIWPVRVENDDNDKCIAYRFDIDKPKLLLVVLKAECDISRVRNNSMRFGVDFICRKDMKSNVAYPYSYILFEHLNNDLKMQLTSREIMLPYRQMYASIDGNGNGLEEYLPNYIGRFFKSLEDKFTELQESGESAAKVCYELIEEVYATWMLHVQKRGFLPRTADESPKDVVLDIEDDSSSGSGQTLVSQYELLKFVFENSFNAAIRSFLKENRPDGGTGSLKIKNQKGSTERMIVSLPSKIAAVLTAVSQMKVRFIDDEFSKLVDEDLSVLAIINKQLTLWIKEVIGDDKKVCINLDETDQRWARQFKNEFKLGLTKDVAIEVGSVDDLNDRGCKYWLGRFENYVSSTILDQAETFLSKYEERYITLPKIPESRSNNAIHTDVDPCSEFLWNAQKLTITSNSKKRSEAIVNQAICYFRHGDARQKTIGDNYYEPLSGSQSTFNVFRSVCNDLSHSHNPATHCKIVGFLTRLVENAAFRILIVDERVAKFVRDHSEVGDILGGLRIAVADDTNINVMRMFSSEQIDGALKFSNVELKEFEIVVIHQGIIDKLLHGHEDKCKVKDWLDKLVEKLHYVVITTGRGSPSNIPDTARVLPYSVIENSLLQRFPEKMLLVDAIMNILPVRKEEM